MTAQTSALRALFFDLDGTLINTLPDIHAAASQTLAMLGLPPVALGAARGYIGDGMPRFIKRLLTGERWAEPPADLFSQARVLMDKNYGALCAARCEVYPGVVHALSRFAAAGLRLACVTNKPERFTTPLLAAAGLESFFHIVVCGDTLAEKKPHPLPLHYASERLQTPIENCAHIGDSAADQKAADAAGCAFFYAVSYGYGKPESAAAFADDFAALADLILAPGLTAAADCADNIAA